MTINECRVLECVSDTSLSGAPKKNWVPIKNAVLRLFEVESVRIVNTADYENVDYIGLTFDLDITRKNRLKIDEEEYTIKGQVITGSVNRLLLKKVVFENDKR